MEKGRVVVLDNGGATCKIGFGGEAEPVKVIPNFVAKAKSLKRPFVADLVDTCPDIKVQPSSTSLLVSEPLFSLPGIQRSMAELAFEHFAFRSYLPVPSPVLAYRHEGVCVCVAACSLLWQSSVLRDSPPAPQMPSLLATSSAAAASSAMALEAGCGLVVDAGFSFTHAVPIWNNRPLLQAVRRMNVGGKALTNVLKEAVSYRAWNMMDETLIMDHAKEQLCFVRSLLPSLLPSRLPSFFPSLLPSHLPSTLNPKPSSSRPLCLCSCSFFRKRDASNIFRAEYLLPDGVTLLRGQVKDRTAAMQAVKAQEELWEQHLAEEVEEARGTRGGTRGRKRGGALLEGRTRRGCDGVDRGEEDGEMGRKRGRSGWKGERGDEEGGRRQQQGGRGGDGGIAGGDDEDEEDEEEDEDWDERKGRGKAKGGATAAGSGGGNSGGATAAGSGGGNSGGAGGGASVVMPPPANSRGAAGGGGPGSRTGGSSSEQPELSLASERFMVPEGLFHPSDLGVSQAGLAETIVAAVTAAPRVIHPLLYSNIVLVGGSCQLPFFKERLALELRPLVPDSLPINISLSQRFEVTFESTQKSPRKVHDPLISLHHSMHATFESR
ncbi:unnamed protein product [Closterium sp. NIES-65]|nr:unnamed protein product [Closterium sp. NIES-65]